MKVVPPKNDNGGKSFKAKPLLPLVPEEQPELDKSQTASFKLLSNPADPGSPQYYFTIPFLDGDDGPVRDVLTWIKNAEKVAQGLGIKDVKPRMELHKKTLRASALFAFQEAEREQTKILVEEVKKAVYDRTKGSDADKKAAVA